MSDNINKKSKEINVQFLLLSIVLWLMTIFWMYIIFALSADSATDSSAKSLLVTNFINSKLDVSIPEAIIRKSAHVFEFGFLSACSYVSMHFTNLISVKTSYAESQIKVIKSDNEVCILFSLWISILYSVFDEYHQIFVNGRNGSIYDVIFDCLGIFLMLLIIRLIFSIKLRAIGKQEIRYD